MKKILSLILTVGAAVAVHAQGNFLPGTYFSDPNTTMAGGVVYDTTTTGSGPNGSGLAYGSGYQGQYYIGAAGISDPSQLTAVGPQAGFLGSSASDTVLQGAGYFEGNGDAAISTTFAGGATVTLQLRAWKGNSSSTYDTATVKGGSQLLQIALGDPNHNPPIAATQITTMPNFALAAPEPATIALGLMGAGALFIRRRKV